MRDWLHFEIELLSPPSSPQLPTGISLHLMDLDEDWDLVGPAMDEAFEDHWGTIALPVTDEPDSAVADPDEADYGALMHATFNAFWQSGLHRVILDTDAESFTAAPRFYTRLGMKVYRRERLFEKTIRPGVDPRRL